MSKSKLVVGIVAALSTLWASGCASSETSREAFTRQALAEWKMREAHLVRLQVILGEPASRVVELDATPGLEPTFADESVVGSW